VTVIANKKVSHPDWGCWWIALYYFSYSNC